MTVERNGEGRNTKQKITVVHCDVLKFVFTPFSKQGFAFTL